MSPAERFAIALAPMRWRDVMRRDEALPALDARTLLHAGPPYDGEAPVPVRRSAALALVFEGLAADEADGLAMLARGEARLEPAQDHGVATPLAQVVSASMPLAVVGDDRSTAFAPLVESPPPALRFGSGTPASVAALRRVDALAREHLAPRLRAAPLALGPVAVRALLAGDECHARTGAANAALVDALGELDAGLREAIASNGSFVLPVLMAAACAALRGNRRGIVAAAGNGIDFGVRHAGERGWRTVPADPPSGPRLPGHADTAALGAIGDSAVLDFAGLGAQAIAMAPVLLEDWATVLPPDAATRRDAIVDPASGLVDPDRIAATGRAPRVHLAILERDVGAGLIGRGPYEVPMDAFAAPAGR